MGVPRIFPERANSGFFQGWEKEFFPGKGQQWLKTLTEKHFLTG